MPYEYVPDKQRTDTYPVDEKLSKMCEDLTTNVSIENLKYFDEEEQELILDAIDELADVIENSNGSHSATYYRTVFLSELFGYEDMEDDAQEAACRIALGLYRKARPENDPKLANRTMTDEEAIILAGYGEEALKGEVPAGFGKNPMNSKTGAPYSRYLVLNGDIEKACCGNEPDGWMTSFKELLSTLKDADGNPLDESMPIVSMPGIDYPSMQSSATDAVFTDENGNSVYVVFVDGENLYKLAELSENVSGDYANELADIYHMTVQYAIDNDHNVRAREMDVLNARNGMLRTLYAEDEIVDGAYAEESFLGGFDTDETIESKMSLTATDVHGTRFTATFERHNPANPEAWEMNISNDTANELIASACGYEPWQAGEDAAYEDLCESCSEYNTQLDFDYAQFIVIDILEWVEYFQEAIDCGQEMRLNSMARSYKEATLDYNDEHGRTYALSWTSSDSNADDGNDGAGTLSHIGCAMSSPEGIDGLFALAEQCDGIDTEEMKELSYKELESVLHAVQFLSKCAGGTFGDFADMFSARQAIDISDELLDKYVMPLAEMLWQQHIPNCVPNESESGDSEYEAVFAGSKPVADSAPLPKRLTTTGKGDGRNLCFTTKMEDGKLTFSAQTFGIGKEKVLFEVPTDVLSDDGMNEIAFSEASFAWDEIDGMAEAFPTWAGDETMFYDIAESAYCHALREMLGFEDLVCCDISNVCGYENMENIKQDEEYQAIFDMLAASYGIKLTDEQKEKFKNGEEFDAMTPMGAVKISPKQMQDELDAQRNPEEGNEEENEG